MEKNIIISKLLNNSKVVYNNFNWLNIYYLFNYSDYIIFFDYKQLTNKDMYLLKNELYELKVNSKILLKKEKNFLFSSKFIFLGGNLFCIFTTDIKKFIEISKILFLKKIIFFFSFKKHISNILKDNNQFDLLGSKVFIIIHFLIFKLIKNIIIILLYFLLILIKYINIK